MKFLAVRVDKSSSCRLRSLSSWSRERSRSRSQMVQSTSVAPSTSPGRSSQAPARSSGSPHFPPMESVPVSTPSLLPFPSAEATMDQKRQYYTSLCSIFGLSPPSGAPSGPMGVMSVLTGSSPTVYTSVLAHSLESNSGVGARLRTALVTFASSCCPDTPHCAVGLVDSA
ncbi:hypothetical protein NDU88_001817 [Pleurodeles waltl]|uniref:Uncharacterized protein n=1 Tax=Pleurodeles waltl TaxID=8319 RepID=A0AAV7Q888_PLEWA|nr:hypothetical protein NDU88_001817 [Pleurodeles waltl]